MEPEKKSSGAFIGLAIIIIILVVGGIYVWQLNKKTANTLPETVTTQDSDALNTLEAGIQAADTNINADVNGLK